MNKPTLFTNICTGIFAASVTYIAIQKGRSQEIPTLEQIIETEQQEEKRKNKKNHNSYKY